MKGIVIWSISIVCCVIIGTVVFLVVQDSYGLDTITIEQKIQQYKKESLPIIGMITPHHLVAEEMIEDIFEKTAQENEGMKIDNIILISPNHFNAEGGNVMISDKNWTGDELFINTLTNKKLAYINNIDFKKEHGIQSILPFIDKYFPDVHILPMMIATGTHSSDMDILARELATNQIFSNTLIILSSDFSHELTPQISDIHDKIAIDTIKHFDFNNVYNLDTDCVEGLYLLMSFAKYKGYNNFNFIDNSNSSVIYNNYFIGDNTSYVTGQFVNKGNEDLELDRAVSLSFGGDVMLDRTVRQSIDKLGASYFTQDIKRMFWAQDMNMMNMEGPITENESISNVEQDNPNHFKFTFDPKHTKEFLSTNRINSVTIGNNHILNFGVEGVEQTEEFLKENKVLYIGVPDENTKNIAYKDVKGRKIAFVSYNDFASPSIEKTIENIKEASSNSDFVIVFTHWGQEYNKKMTSVQQKQAHNFIDAGAKVIMGAHPHVIEPIEIYKDGVIFYSLGNFVFDQFFDDDVRERLLVHMLIDVNNQLQFVLTPLYTGRAGKLELAEDVRRTKILQEIANNSVVSEKDKEQIVLGNIKIK